MVVASSAPWEEKYIVVELIIIIIYFLFLCPFFFTYKQFCSQSPQGFWLACYHFTASTYSGYKIAF